MTERSRLIAIASALPINGENRKLYNFITRYIEKMKADGKTETDDVFGMVKQIMSLCPGETVDDPDVKKALGIEGKKGMLVNSWCHKMLSHDGIKRLTLDELHYVMGYAFRLCRIYEAEHGGQRQGGQYRGGYGGEKRKTH